MNRIDELHVRPGPLRAALAVLFAVLFPLQWGLLLPANAAATYSLAAEGVLSVPHDDEHDGQPSLIKHADREMPSAVHRDASRHRDANRGSDEGCEVHCAPLTAVAADGPFLSHPPSGCPVPFVQAALPPSPSHAPEKPPRG